MRNEHLIPFDWIADHARWVQQPETWNSPRDAIQDVRDRYRRPFWVNQDVYVQVWLEKDALAGIVSRVTDPYDVPLMVTRGYPSVSFLHLAAETIEEQAKPVYEEQDKPTYLYYIGDWDPSGMDIPIKVEDGIREYAPDVELHFERIAVTEDQIARYDLPTRPTKTTDSRSKHFQGESVEVDAIKADDLQTIVNEKITEHLDQAALDSVMVAEESDRKNLDELLRTYDAGEMP